MKLINGRDEFWRELVRVGNPVEGAAYRAFRIQTVRDSLREPEVVPFTGTCDPFDEELGERYFGIYGVEDDVTMEHIADRGTFAEARERIQRVGPWRMTLSGMGVFRWHGRRKRRGNGSGFAQGRGGRKWLDPVSGQRSAQSFQLPDVRKKLWSNWICSAIFQRWV